MEWLCQEKAPCQPTGKQHRRTCPTADSRFMPFSISYKTKNYFSQHTEIGIMNGDIFGWSIVWLTIHLKGKTRRSLDETQCAEFEADILDSALLHQSYDESLHLLF